MSSHKIIVEVNLVLLPEGLKRWCRIDIIFVFTKRLLPLGSTVAVRSVMDS